MPSGAIDAAKATELNLSLIRHRRIAPAAAVEEAINEFGFGRVVRPSMQPDVETCWFIRIIVFWKRHAVRKHRALNLRLVREDLPPPLIPFRLIGLELLAALDSLIECAQRVRDRGLRTEHVRILQEHLPGVCIGLYI